MKLYMEYEKILRIDVMHSKRFRLKINCSIESVLCFADKFLSKLDFLK